MRSRRAATSATRGGARALFSLVAVVLLLPALAEPARAEVVDRPLAPITILEDGRSTPHTRLDGVESIRAAASSSETFTRLQRALVARQSIGTPFHERLDVRLEPGTLVAEATYTQVGDAPGNLTFRFALVLEGAPGDLHRFILLVRADDVPAETRENRDLVARARFPLDAGVDRDRLAVVAYVESAEDHGRHRRGEALQAALWTAGQDGATVQRSKGILVEHFTADGCAACSGSDESVALLLSQNGLRAEAGEARSYAVRPSLFAFVGLIGGAALGLALVRGTGATRRRRR